MAENVVSSQEFNLDKLSLSLSLIRNCLLSFAYCCRWWSEETVAVVTGAGKGIGLETVKALSREGITVILTLRNEQAAQSLVEKLEKEEGLKVRYHSLDLSDDSSVDKFAKWVEQNFKGVDILVNNAGLLLHPVEHNLKEALPVIEVNYWGTKRLTQALLPLMKETQAGARIVNLSTLGSRLDILHNEWREKLSDIDNLTEEVIEEFISSYLEAVKCGKQFNSGWPEEFNRIDYCVAKMALNAYTRLLAKKLSAQGRRIYVNCTSPGHTSCVMSGHTGHHPAEGASTAVWLALMPAGMAHSGEYFVKRKNVGFFEIPLAHFDEVYYDVKEIKAHLHQNANYTRHK